MDIKTVQSWLEIVRAQIISVTNCFTDLVKQAYGLVTNGWTYTASVAFGTGFALWMGATNLLTMAITALSAMAAFQIVAGIAAFFGFALSSFTSCEEPTITEIDEALAAELQRHFRGA